MGAACGRTLYAIEELLQSTAEDETITTKRPVFAPNRPLCLWDSESAQAPTTDAFGRSPLYARTSDKTKHVASLEQYHQDECLESSGIWETFVKTHWPDLDRDNEPHRASLRGNTNPRAENAPAADDSTLWNGGADSSPKRRTQAAI